MGKLDNKHKNKMKNKLFFGFVAILILAFCFAVTAEKMSSGNYNSDSIISSGGDALSSNNYNSTAITGIVSGEISSANYNNSLGFFYRTNNAPTVALISPEDGNVTTNRTPTFYWNGSDADGDALTYELNITCNPGCSDDSRFMTGIADENYTITSYLKYLSDDGFYYNWSVRANDGKGYGNWSGERVLKVQAELSISLPVNSVNFGEIGMNGRVNTTTDNPAPLKIQNDGNCRLNVTMAGTSLWSAAAMPSSYFQFKADNSTETGSFSWNESATSWTNVPTGAVIAISKLNWADSTDSAEVDLLAEVPGNEPAGSKSSILTFESSLAE